MFESLRHFLIALEKSARDDFTWRDVSVFKPSGIFPALPCCAETLDSESLITAEKPVMSEDKTLIALLNVAEGWAARARSSLMHIHALDRSGFVAGRRPEDRALLAAAADVVDVVRAAPGGAALLDDLGIGVPSSMRLTEADLRERLAPFSGVSSADGVRG